MCIRDSPSPGVSEVSQSRLTAELSVQSIVNDDLTGPIMVDHAEAKSTPILIKSNKTKEKKLSLDDLLDFMKVNFDKQNNDLNKRFDDNDKMRTAEY